MVKGASSRTVSRETKAYVGLVAVLGIGAVLVSSPRLPDSPGQWVTLGVLVCLGSLAQFFPVITPKSQAYYVTLVFMFAGVVLLPAGALAILMVAIFIPEWVKARYPWYTQGFNIANYLLDAMIARAVYLALRDVLDTGVPFMSELVAALVAAAVFTIMNHALLACALRLGRGHSWKETGLFERDNLFTDGTMASTGVITALLWQVNPSLVVLIAAPLFLYYRALNTPNLQEQARMDSKTGLYNARHFWQILREELHRARRFDRPLAVIMADMDLLRNINNTYGHLAGDVVLKGVADTIRNELRDYDIAARFGGEEFAIILPETDAGQALAAAERMRRKVEAERFSVDTSVEPIRVTLSLGVAAFPVHGYEAQELIHQADLAVYYAKLRGRNQAWVCSAESRALASKISGGRSVHMPFDASQSYHATHPNARKPMGFRPVGSVPEKIGDEGATLTQSAVPQEATRISTGGASAATHAGPAVSAPRRKRERANDLEWPVVAFIGSVLLLAGLVWSVWQPWQSWQQNRVEDWVALGMLAVLTAVSQSMPIDIYGLGRISTSAIILIAGGMVFGVPGAVLLAPIVGIAQWTISRGKLHKFLFDVGATTLAATAAALTYHHVLGPVPDLGLLRIESLSVFTLSHLLLLSLLAGVAYYVINIGSLSVVMGLSEKTTPVRIWAERFRWLVVHYLVYGVMALFIVLAYAAIGYAGLGVFFVPVIMLRYVMKQYVDRTQETVRELKRLNEEMTRANEEVGHTLAELRETYGATLQALSAALDSRDSETEGHSRRVVQYTAAIARELGISLEGNQGLLNGALLHDVGKIGVPDAILLKPAPLTDSEWSIMRQHPDVGSRMIGHIGFLSDAVPIVRHHHERYDGSGYPDGLAGEEIPLGARIFAVADAFDAMTSRRPYRLPCSVEVACEEIQRCAGTHFDPHVVEAFLRIDVAMLGNLSGQATVTETASHPNGQRTASLGHLDHLDPDMGSAQSA